MPGPHARPRLGRLAAEAVGRPRIDHLGGLLRERPLHVAYAGDRSGIELGLERARLALDCARLQRAAFRLPLRQAAVENEHVLGPEGAKRPPYPRRAAEPDAVIDHDGVAVGDAERADIVRE